MSAKKKRGRNKDNGVEKNLKKKWSKRMLKKNNEYI